MTSLLSYLHTCFIRSYRFGPPSFLFLAGIVFVYSVVPNPVMESYSFSASFLFVISSMLTYSMMDIETENQEAISLIHTGSIKTLYAAKLLYSWLFTMPFACFAVLYPIVFQSFNRAASPEELVMSMFYHISSSWLAVAITCWFSAKFIRSRLTSFLLLSLLIVIVFSAQSLENLLPNGLHHIALLIPPMYRTVDLLYNYENQLLIMKWLPIAASLLYGFISAALFLVVMMRRKLDSPL